MPFSSVPEQLARDSAAAPPDAALQRPPARPPRSRAIKRLEYALLGLVLIWALVIRVYRLDAPLFWVDESESTINALTILQHGLPLDRYLGQPVYENTLVEPWPGNEEYEFKDSSYSNKRVAIYHGWLPLYAMAGSLKAMGVRPDSVPDRLTVKHSDEEMSRMTIAARLPAVVFSMALLVLLFLAGSEMYGRDAAWAALVIGAFSERVLDFARQARYYSATVTFSTACCLMLWRIHRHGRWRDYLIAAVVFVLLFYTHVVTFLVASAAGALLLLSSAVWRRGALPKLAVFCLIVLGCALPWLLGSGFLSQARGIPNAFPYLDFPQDLFTFPMSKLHTVLLLAAGLLGLIAAEVMRRRLPPRFARPFRDGRAAFFFLFGWVVLGYLSFVTMMPAVSYIFTRMQLPMLGPGAVLAGLIFAAIARAIMRRPQPLAAVALAAVFMLVFAHVKPWPGDPGTTLSRNTGEMIRWLRGREFAPGTRIYATPNSHLTYSVYTGMPVQSVAPVRKSWLDSYPGPVVVIENMPHYMVPTAQELREALHNPDISNDEAGGWGAYIIGRAWREKLPERFASVFPPLSSETVRPEIRPLIDSRPQETVKYLQVTDNPIFVVPAVFRGYPLRELPDWWQVYFYRFADVDRHTGKNLNFLDRIRNAKATVLFSGWTVYESPTPAVPAP